MEPRLSMNFLSMIETRLIPRTNENLDASFFFFGGMEKEKTV